MGVVKQKNWFFFFPKSSYSCAKQTKAKPCDTAGVLPIFSAVVAELWF